MSAVGLAIRWAHLASVVLLVGSLATVLLAGRSDRPTARRWEARMIRWARALALAALASAVALLAHQTAVLEARPIAALEARSLLRVLLATQWGIVWLVRASLLVLLAAFVSVRLDVERRADWRAARGEATLLGAGALGALSLAGHAVAVEPDTARAVAVDALHLLAAGVWVGGLLPLAALLRAASRDDGADARPYAVVAARRFSRLALASALALALSGAVNAVLQVGSVPSLVGTPYGRLLLVKLAILVPILGLGAANRTRLVPALAGEAGTVGLPAMRRLALSAIAEATLAAALLGVVAALSFTAPGRHIQPTWPFPFRLSADALAGAPAATSRVLVGSQVAVLGLVGIVAALLLRSRRLPLTVAATIVLGLGVGIGAPPLALDAYPTTYRRPAIPYQAASIAAGAALFQAHCAACHRATEPRGGPPAELVGPRIARHTAGDLFWWITRGIPGAGMPPFGATLSEEQRWDLVNFVRLLAATEAARALGPTIEPERPWLVAPDFTFAVGPTPPRALRDYRGRRIVLLVLYSLPLSRPRLAQLAESYDLLATLGAEVIVVPMDAAPDAIRRLGAEPRMLFPVVTDGAREIVTTYRRFGPARHAEFLVDRQGYLRARWTTDGPPIREVNPLLAEIQELNAEKTLAPAPEEHVH